MIAKVLQNSDSKHLGPAWGYYSKNICLKVLERLKWEQLLACHQACLPSWRPLNSVSSFEEAWHPDHIKK